mmetsp:Transcript_10955/g.15416  ORF Transcript_10955/g.15416 Transcript_10955/m.15416 type:complete len:88 (+) Transcript_10955:640-903(+)
MNEVQEEEAIQKYSMTCNNHITPYVTSRQVTSRSIHHECKNVKVSRVKRESMTPKKRDGRRVREERDTVRFLDKIYNFISHEFEKEP